jgi:hypothetical protein
LLAKPSTTVTHDSHYSTCLGYLGQGNTDRIVSIFVVLSKMAKASTSVSLSRVFVAIVITPTFANVNTALEQI